jgi:BASS family bile acid:Na+ symporter
MPRFLALAADAFPIWILLGAAIALVEPSVFTWFSGPWIIWTLALVMLGMGLTLEPADFKRVGTMPRPVALGFVAQYTIMPALGWGIARGLQLDGPFAVGLILVACCPGGTASNIVTYLARADVALSVVMTMCSTFAAVFMTPLLTSWLAGTWVKVDGWGLFVSTAQVVLLPILLGLALRRLAPRAVARALPVTPVASVMGVMLIVSSIVGANAPAIRASAGTLVLAVFLLHAGGFGLGYLFAQVSGQAETTRRTIAIEVGMQNSGLGVVLARQNFADPLTAVPCAISSVFHSVIGSLLAGWWRWRDGRKQGLA